MKNVEHDLQAATTTFVQIVTFFFDFLTKANALKILLRFLNNSLQ